jgi:hypothetical protein
LRYTRFRLRPLSARRRRRLGRLSRRFCQRCITLRAPHQFRRHALLHAWYALRKHRTALAGQRFLGRAERIEFMQLVEHV